MKPYEITTDSPLTLSGLNDLLASSQHIVLSEESIEKLKRCRDFLDHKLSTSSSPIYGVNTGFGSLYKHVISNDQIEQLQENLVLSHACGAGPLIPHELVKLMLFLKIYSLSKGYSGVQESTVQRLVDMYNEQIWPCIYEIGSLGASGDLVPLAHLVLPLLGEGQVYHKGQYTTSKEVLNKLKWEPVHFQSKEGLALLNGTQFMSAYGVWTTLHAQQLVRLSNLIGALALDVFDGRMESFDERVHRIRPHAGQCQVAKDIRTILHGSELIEQSKTHTQDPYSFRCMPQVHGASLDSLNFIEKIVLTEINGVSDNPNIFPEEDTIISAGNFHGQHMALALDFLAISVSELGSISERRLFQLLSGSRHLPNYLVSSPGINSGLMIMQYSAAALVSQNKQLCTPASVDSIVTSNGQEDHVSMGANAATKAYRVIQNVYTILAMEWIAAVQGLHFHRPLRTSPILEKHVDAFQKQVRFIDKDRLLHDDITKAERFIRKLSHET